MHDPKCSMFLYSDPFSVFPSSRRRLIGWPQEPHHVVAFSAPQPRQGAVPTTLVADDSASPLLSQPPEMLPMLESGAGGSPTSLEVRKICGGSTTSPEVPLEPEERGVCVDHASSLSSDKPLQKVKNALRVLRLLAVWFTCLQYVHVCPHVSLQSTVLEEVDKAKRRLQEVIS